MSVAEWAEVEIPGAVWRDLLQPAGCREGHAFSCGPVQALVSRGVPALSWHIAVSCKNRYPTWEEIKKARYDLIPDGVTMAVLLPANADLVKRYRNCLHLHEVFLAHSSELLA